MCQFSARLKVDDDKWNVWPFFFLVDHYDVQSVSPLPCCCSSVLLIENPHGRLVTLAGVAFNLSVQTLSCLSVTHQIQTTALSAALISPADGVTGSSPLRACSVFRLLILIFLLLFFPYLHSFRNEWGESRWRAVDRVPLGDRGWQAFPAVSFLSYLLERRNRHIPPSLSGCHSAPSI